MHAETVSPVHTLPPPCCKELGKSVCILKQDLWKTDLIALSHTHTYTYTTLHQPSACPCVAQPAQLTGTWDSGAEPSSHLLCSPKAASSALVQAVPFASFQRWGMMAPLVSLTGPFWKVLSSTGPLLEVLSSNACPFHQHRQLSHPALSPPSITCPRLWAEPCLGRLQAGVPSA